MLSAELQKSVDSAIVFLDALKKTHDELDAKIESSRLDFTDDERCRRREAAITLNAEAHAWADLMAESNETELAAKFATYIV